ncbi:hypothetical protein ASF61_13020 [Duganella sp. Leaf126]|uniref:VOC family protein n=1 Tax=Duganella sp. Leaf126 TaxID=1736266 RepID=UPI0006F9E371|nr:VOC family protein [Duganella sp. Leaf126]KQQ32999.1 hypothetical protein ASF61_13020 [Duganella sp. Leaf126]
MSHHPDVPPADRASPFASWHGDHAGIRVPDFDSAVAWYTGKLDFRVLSTMALGEKTLAMLCPANDDSFRIEFIAGPGCTARPAFDELIDTHAIGGWHHLCLRVDSVDDAITELRQRQVRIVSAPKDAPALGLRFVFISDPWGNLIELAQQL